MNARLYEFNVGITASVQPDAGAPSLANDLVTKGYADSVYVQPPFISGSVASPLNITAVGGVPFTGLASQFLHLAFLQGSGAAVNISANPQVAAGTAIGQRLTLRGCSNTNTVTLEDGAGLSLNGECILANGSIIELLWNGTVWDEISRNML